MTTTEASLESAFRQGVVRIGGLTVKLAPTVKGVPDRMVLFQGQVHLVELKTETGRLSPAQQAWHRKASDRGVVVTTLYGKAEIEEWLALLAATR